MGGCREGENGRKDIKGKLVLGEPPGSWFWQISRGVTSGGGREHPGGLFSQIAGAGRGKGMRGMGWRGTWKGEQVGRRGEGET